MSWTQVEEEAQVADGKTEAQREAAQTPMEAILAKPKVEVNRKKVLKAKESILTEAHNIIYGDREKTYGHPAKNLKTIASMWTAYMNNMDDGNFTITAKDVAAMMMLVKVARFANDPTHRDNLVDVCGYAALIERCDEVAK
jgi:hypothetical protein